MQAAYSQNKNISDTRLDNKIPPYATYVWRVFNSLTRPQGMSGINRISQQEIAAYQSNYNVKLSEWELEMIQLMDSVLIETHKG